MIVSVSNDVGEMLSLQFKKALLCADTHTEQQKAHNNDIKNFLKKISLKNLIISDSRFKYFVSIQQSFNISKFS